MEKDIHKRLEDIKLVAQHNAIEHGCNYTVFQHAGNTYEAVTDSYWEKERPHAKKLFLYDPEGNETDLQNEEIILHAPMPELEEEPTKALLVADPGHEARRMAALMAAEHAMASNKGLASMAAADMPIGSALGGPYDKAVEEVYEFTNPYADLDLLPPGKKNDCSKKHRYKHNGWIDKDGNHVFTYPQNGMAKEVWQCECGRTL